MCLNIMSEHCGLFVLNLSYSLHFGEINDSQSYVCEWNPEIICLPIIAMRQGERS